MSEIDQQDEPDVEELNEDVEMASIAEEEEELYEKFSHQSTSTGKLSGKRKIVIVLKIFIQILF